MYKYNYWEDKIIIINNLLYNIIINQIKEKIYSKHMWHLWHTKLDIYYKGAVILKTILIENQQFEKKYKNKYIFTTKRKSNIFYLYHSGEKTRY